MQCERCEGEISQTAKACKHCGALTLAGKAEERKIQSEKPIGCLSWIGISLGVLVAVFIISSLLSPHETVEQWHERLKSRCIANNGEGEWVGSSGMTLDQFCDGAASLQILEADKKAHPEKY